MAVHDAQAGEVASTAGLRVLRENPTNSDLYLRHNDIVIPLFRGDTHQTIHHRWWLQGQLKRKD